MVGSGKSEAERPLTAAGGLRAANETMIGAKLGEGLCNLHGGVGLNVDVSFVADRDKLIPTDGQTFVAIALDVGKNSECAENYYWGIPSPFLPKS